MYRARSLLGIALVLLTLPFPAAHAAMDDSWLRAGFTAAYAGHSAGLAPSGQPNDPSRGGLFVAEITSVDAATVTFHFSGHDGYSSTATYDLATRKQTGTWAHAILWVTDADVARGSAVIGEKVAVLVHSDGTLHQFESAGTSYFYDARTGLLTHIVSIGYGGAAARIPA